MGGLDRVITGRLNDLDAEERDAVELLAVAGPLAVDLLEKMVGTDPPETLTAVGLVAVLGLGDALTARLTHPLHRECLRREVDGIHRRHSFVAWWPPPPTPGTVISGRSDPATLVRLALWHAKLGVAFDPAALGWAARTVQGGLFDLVGRHQAGEHGTPGEEEPGLAVGLKSAQERSDAAWRLAASAWRAEKTFANGLALARGLVMRADLAEEMVAVLGDLGDLATSDEERAWLAVIQGIWHFWIVGDRAGATSELASVQDLLGRRGTSWLPAPEAASTSRAAASAPACACSKEPSRARARPPTSGSLTTRPWRPVWCSTDASGTVSSSPSGPCRWRLPRGTAAPRR